MAILWFDGFNDSPAAIALRYATAGVAAMAANPLTGRAVVLSGAETIARAVPFGDATAVLGVAFRADSAPASGVIALLTISEGATAHLVLGYDCASRTLRLSRGDGAALASGTTVLPAPAADYTAWRYIEIKATIADAGSAEVRVDGVVDMALSADTRNGATAAPDAIALGDATAIGQAFAYDDLYVLDGTASPASFLGRYTTVSPIAPAAAGAFSGWSPSAGENWSCVAEDDPNGDADYVESDTRGALDTYATTGFSGAPEHVYGVMVTSIARADAIDPQALRNLVLVAGVELAGASHAPGASYAAYSDYYDHDPATGAAWNAYGLGRMQLGIEDGTGAFERYVTSRPYPIAPLEPMTLGVTLVDGELRGQAFVEDASAASFAVSLVSGDLRNPIRAASVTDGAGLGASLVSGLLKTALLGVSAPPESAAMTVSLVTGELRVTLRSYTTAAPEKASLSIALVSGDLT